MKKIVLDNGFEIFYKKIRTKTLLLAIGAKIGSIYEDEKYRGISHFLEHMMFKSNKKYSAKEINLKLEEISLTNALTSHFYTVYFSEFLPKNFSKVLNIFLSMFENEKYDEKEFENEKKVVLSETERSYNDPEELLNILSLKSVYGNSDYGSFVCGNRESLENVSKEVLEDFKQKYYIANNMFAVLLGNFGNKHIETLKKVFGKLEEIKINKKVPSKKIGKDIEERMNTKNQIYFSLNFEIKNDLINAFAFKNFVSEGLSSLTFQILREKYGIGYKVDFDFLAFYPDSCILSLLIPGFESEKEKFLNEAINDLFENVRKANEKYYKQRINWRTLVFEKIKNNLFERFLKYNECSFILILNNSLDEIYEKTFRVKLEKVKEFLLKLENGKKVFIRPN